MTSSRPLLDTAPGGDKPKDITITTFLRRLWPFVAKYPFFLVIIFVAMFLEAAFNTALPVSFKYIIDYALIGTDMTVEVGKASDELRLIHIIVPLSVGVVIISVIGVGRRYLTHAMLANVIRDIRLRLFDHLQRLSLAFFARRQMGDLLSRFSGDLVAVETTLVNTDAWVLLPGMSVLIDTAVLFYLDWRLAILSLLVWPLCLFLPNLLVAAATRASYKKKNDEAQTLATIQENLDARAVIRAFTLQSWARKLFQSKNAQLCASTRHYGFLSALIEQISLMGLVVLQVIVLGVGAFMAWRGDITIGGLAAFQTIFLSMSLNMGYVTQFMPNLIQATGSLERVEELIGITPDVADAPDAYPLPSFAKEIKLTNVTFGYTPSVKSLDNVSVTVRRGERVAFVGGSGSGKSTILNLVMRFYDPQQGSVAFDGIDARCVTQESLRSRMGVVFQESLLFNLSIKENLQLARPGAADAEIEAAAQAAEIHETIVKMPEGYNTVVGERGGKVSGGQRQRLAIARALLNNPEILILDEATSSLDPVTEAAINDTLERVSRSRTVLMVSHRLTAVQNMDRIVVLDHGRILDEGQHEELLERSGLYAKLWHKQSGFARHEAGSL